MNKKDLYYNISLCDKFKTTDGYSNFTVIFNSKTGVFFSLKYGSIFGAGIGIVDNFQPGCCYYSDGDFKIYDAMSLNWLAGLRIKSKFTDLSDDRKREESIEEQRRISEKLVKQTKKIEKHLVKNEEIKRGLVSLAEMPDGGELSFTEGVKYG